MKTTNKHTGIYYGEKINNLIFIIKLVTHLESKKLEYIFDGRYFDAKMSQKKISELNEYLNLEYQLLN